MKSPRPPTAGPVLLLTPPLVQINAPYPATAWLAGFLRTRGCAARQEDLTHAHALRLFSRPGLAQVEAALRAAPPARAPAVRHFLKHAAACQTVIEPVIRFLQGRDDNLAHRIAARAYLPEGPRFQPLAATPSPLDLFGAGAVRDKARHLASLFLDDLADAVRDGLDPRFAFARYADHLAVSAPDFAPLAAALAAAPSFMDGLIDELAADAQARHKPRFVGLTVPFPGTLYGALRIARALKKADPAIRIALGGGYVNTELRELAEPRLFDAVDYVTLDDGELPLLRALAHADGKIGDDRLVRTWVRRSGKVVFLNAEAGEPDPPPMADIVPAYEDLPLDRYVGMAESPNPMHRLWSDGLWLKLPAARGCYWHRCRFCDVSLPYIARYSPTPADALADKLEALIARTGRTGFHFTDEALAPALLGGLADRLIARGVPAVWWGNIRFEKGFSPELAAKMAAAGCVAVTGGLECAHDRLLALMDKGITLKDAARACSAFAGAGILVHAYLMTGFPTQTLQETVDGLEFVRQGFEEGILQSAFWHRFALSVHSPIAREPAHYGLKLLHRPAGGFACNELPYEEPGAPDPVELEACLRRATYNFMHGVCLDLPVHKWFPGRTPKARLAPGSVARWIRTR
jgi:hypothetical protein